MPQHRKKPIVIHATQWFKNGDHPDDYRNFREGFNAEGVLTQYTPTWAKVHDWEGDVVRYFRRPDKPGTEVCGYCLFLYNSHGWIDTLEGGHIVCPGDWIITGVQGEYYPCKSDIFERTHEKVE